MWVLTRSFAGVPSIVFHLAVLRLHSGTEDAGVHHVAVVVPGQQELKFRNVYLYTLSANLSLCGVFLKKRLKMKHHLPEISYLPCPYWQKQEIGNLILRTIHLGRGCWWTPYCLVQSARPTSQEPRKVGEKERKIAKLLELSQQKTKIFYLGYFFHIFKVFLNHILENVSALRSWTKAHWKRFNSRNKRKTALHRTMREMNMT